MWPVKSRCKWTAAAAVGIVCVMVCSLATAQITFSRDWTGGGKRGAGRFAIDCDQFSRICRHFIHELKHAINCELKTTKHYRGEKHEYDEHLLEYEEP